MSLSNHLSDNLFLLRVSARLLRLKILFTVALDGVAVWNFMDVVFIVDIKISMTLTSNI